MKIFFFLVTLLSLVYLTQATRTNLRLIVYNSQINVPIGKLSVILHGVTNKKEYTFNQTKFKYPRQEVTGVTEFPEEEIQKVEVKWVAQNEDNLKIGTFSLEVYTDRKIFIPKNGDPENLINGETIVLVKSF